MSAVDVKRVASCIYRGDQVVVSLASQHRIVKMTLLDGWLNVIDIHKGGLIDHTGETEIEIPDKRALLVAVADTLRGAAG
jgi:hypothetical protein